MTLRKVFGLGLSKTGTKTLSYALSVLGYRGTSYDHNLLIEWSQGRHENIWRRIEQFDSFEDWPYPLFYREIMNRFGDNAFYVITMRRDARTWLESLKRHALRGNPANAIYREIAYGVAYPHLDEAGLIDRYERHQIAVLDTAERLGLSSRVGTMCWETGDGWPQLCSLISRPIPTEQFPHRNSTASIRPDQAVVLENLRIIEELRRQSQDK